MCVSSFKSPIEGRESRDWAYGLSLTRYLFNNTLRSNHLQMSEQGQYFRLNYYKTPNVGPCKNRLGTQASYKVDWHLPNYANQKTACFQSKAYLLHRFECSTEKQTTRICIRNYIQDTSEIFSISSLVKIPLMSFLCFPLLFVQLVFFF